MMNRSTSLAMSTRDLNALPGKLDIKIHSPSILDLYENHKINNVPLRTFSQFYSFVNEPQHVVSNNVKSVDSDEHVQTSYKLRNSNYV